MKINDFGRVRKTTLKATWADLRRTTHATRNVVTEEEALGRGATAIKNKNPTLNVGHNQKHVCHCCVTYSRGKQGVT